MGQDGFVAGVIDYFRAKCSEATILFYIQRQCASLWSPGPTCTTIFPSDSSQVTNSRPQKIIGHVNYSLSPSFSATVIITSMAAPGFGNREAITRNMVSLSMNCVQSDLLWR